MSLKVMISSTIRDLPEHREAVQRACLRQKMLPLMMEYLPADSVTPADVSVGMVDEADAYVGIIAYRYGTLREGQQRSITEEEYERAKERGIPRLVFLIDRKHLVTADDFEQDAVAREKLDSFKERLKAENTVNFFLSPDDLGAKVLNSLSNLREKDVTSFHYWTEVPRPPEPYIPHPYVLLQTRDLIGRRSELGVLTDWLRSGAAPTTGLGLGERDGAKVLAFVAIGGMGKSAVTWEWFNRVAAAGESSLAGSIWWSFYESGAHFDNFLSWTLAYVTGRPVDEIQQLPATRRQRRLLEILDREPYLLVLDGLERVLQAYARLDAPRLTDEDLDEKTSNVLRLSGLPDEDVGGIAAPHRLRKACDPRAGAFLRALTRIGSSRVLITTRLLPSALQRATGEPLPGAYAYLLPGLAPEDAVGLWHALGASGSSDALASLFETFGCHPLLIQALAGEVAHYRRAPGDFETWRNNHPEFDPFSLPLVQRKSHVLAYALQGLDKGAREVLDTVSAFRMPATYDTLAAMLVGEKRLFANESELDLALADLEDRGLLGWNRRANRYDMHPIVRGVTWSSLDEATRTRVFESLDDHFASIPHREPGKAKSVDDLTAEIERFSTLVSLSRYEEAYTLFLEQLREPLLYRFAAGRQCVELLEAFFEDGDDPFPQLASKSDRSYVLNALGLAKAAVGQPAEAADLVDLSNRLDRELGDWKGVAIGLSTRAHMLLLTGRLRAAEASAAEAAKIPRSQQGEFWISMARLEQGLVSAVRGAVAGDSLSHLTRAFGVSPPRSKKALPGGDSLSLAYMAQGALWSGRGQDALRFSDEAWRRVEREDDDRRRLILAARLQGAASLATGDEIRAEERLHVALTEARQVSWVEDEIACLVELAELARRRRELPVARDLLDDVWDLGERGSYRLALADAHNVLARIEQDDGNAEASEGAASKAYHLAWCDGPPYAYSRSLDQARRQLRALGALEPAEPPA